MAEVAISIQKLIKEKNIAIKDVYALLVKVVQHMGQFSLYQNSSHMAVVVNLLKTSTKGWLARLEKLKFEVCLQPLIDRKKRAGRTVGQTSGKKRRVAIKKQGDNNLTVNKQGINNLTLDQVQFMVSHNSRDLVADDSFQKTPVRQPVIPDNQVQVTVPPFNAQDMDMLQIPNEVMSQTKSLNLSIWEPLLDKYKVFLDIGVGQIVRDAQKKRNSTLKKKVRASKAPLDNNIDVSQGLGSLDDIEKLTTKIKHSKSHRYFVQQQFQEQINALHPSLLELDKLLDSLPDLPEKNRFLGHNSPFGTQHSDDLFGMTGMRMVDLSPKRQLFEVNQSQDPAANQRIQQAIKQAIDNELWSNNSVSLLTFCHDKGIRKQVKGVLFYQLLHMDYKLDQTSPQSFGDIFVSHHSATPQRS